MKPKGVTTQMKALDDYFLMVLFTLLLNRVNVFLQFLCLIWTEKHGSEGVKGSSLHTRPLLSCLSMFPAAVLTSFHSFIPTLYSCSSRRAALVLRFRVHPPCLHTSSKPSLISYSSQVNPILLFPSKLREFSTKWHMDLPNRISILCLPVQWVCQWVLPNHLRDTVPAYQGYYWLLHIGANTETKFSG